MERILLLGSQGQVGFELRCTLAPLGELIACDRALCDLAQPDSIRSCVRQARPSLIVNAAAYTAVDKAESEEPLAMAVNATAPGILAEEANRLGALLVHYSTDYVFDGEMQRPYTEKETPSPLNVYGRSKWAGEEAIQAAGGRFLILRTGWIYGSRGKNFLLTILQKAQEQEALKVVNDQWGSPTWSRLLAEATAAILAQDLSEKQGLYHLSSQGKTNWFEFAQAILQDLSPEMVLKLKPIPSSAYPSAAKRPSHSLLSSEKAKTMFQVALPHWRAGFEILKSTMIGR